MFAAMFKSLFDKNKKNPKMDKKEPESEMVEITAKDVEDMLIELNEMKNNSSNDIDNHCSLSNDVTEAIDLLSIVDTNSEISNDDFDNLDDTTSEVSSIGEKNQVPKKAAEDEGAVKLVNQINNLLCPFTWNIKPNNNKNVILSVQNKFGEYNLNIISPEFTFERYVSNLIISYELFHKNEIEPAQMKILEIGKWLEELDRGTDEFYLSINTGLQYVMKATFIHMLFATNLIGECKWLLDDIQSFANFNSRSKATVYAIRASVLTEYGGNVNYLKKACECAKKACEIDPITSHWFYIYSLALTAQRHYMHTYKSRPTENEINAIQQAIMLSDGKNTSYNYHRMTLDKDITIRNYHQSTNKYDKAVIEKNLQDNKRIVQMIKTIVSMEPKDPLIVVNCAKTLMTLPYKVCDFNLGKQYLTKAFQMAPNDVTVLKAIENVVENYKEMSKKNLKPRRTKTKQKRPLMNKLSNLGDDIRSIVGKHNNGENAVPYLIGLVDYYNGHDKWKIMAQICSYTILFKNDLKAGVEYFIPLIEQSGMSTDHLITKHYSSFGSKKFNLSELICNEIRLATNSSNTSSEDMLFYFKALTKIMETCNVKVKDVDSSMKDKLIVNLSAKSTNTTDQSETKLSLNSENLIDKKKKKVPKLAPKNYRPKRLQDSGSNVFTKKPELNKGANKMNFNSNNGSSTSAQSNTYQTNNASNINQMKLKLSKFFPNTNNTYYDDELRLPKNHNFGLGNLRNIQTQSEIEHYTQQLYQHITSDAQQQSNSQNVSSNGFDRYNQNHSNMNSSLQQYPLQNPRLPSLLSLKPTWQSPNKYSKKK